ERQIRNGQLHVCSSLLGDCVYWRWSNGAALNCEDCHLSRRTDFRVQRSHRCESDRVSEPRGNRRPPLLELFARPLEAMVAMPEPPRWQRRPPHVVFGIWRRDDDCRRARELERHALECRETRGVEMLDDFHHTCGVETGTASVTIHERTVKQL